MSTIESDITGPHANLAARKSLVKPVVIMVLIMAVVLGGIFGFQLFKAKMIGKYMAASAAAPQTVSTVTAALSAWQPQFQATGTLRAVRGADLSAQAAGVVDEIKFESGNEVAAGAVLLRLKLNDDAAKLQQLQASAELADLTLKRDQEQLAAQALSQATVDTDVANLKSARAQVAAQQALIDEKIVRAPFSGRLGIRQVDVGQYLAPGTAIVTLQALDPILIDFYLPQQSLASVKPHQAVTARVDTYPSTSFSGVVESVNSKVDSASRNVQVRASFRNADRRLVPGMFASVLIDSSAAEQHVTLPQAAITYNPYGNTVWIVDAQRKDDNGKPRASVTQRFVTLGATRGDQVAVLSGVKAGETVVSAGQIKLRNGVAVTVDNSMTPKNDVSPTPPNE